MIKILIKTAINEPKEFFGSIAVLTALSIILYIGLQLA
jgi:hypothetical protein